MKQQIIAICDKEEAYAYHMQEFLAAKKLPYQIQIFTQNEEFLTFYKNKKIDILIMSQSFYQKQMEKIEISDFYLLKENTNCPDNVAICINKYQSCENILQQIIIHSAENKMNFYLKQGTGARIIGVYTPVKRCLQTSFSLVLGQLLAKKKKVLYLNFEAYSGFSAFICKNFNNDLTDLLYILRNAEGKLMQKLSTMVERVNNLEFIPPSSSVIDLETTSGEEIEKLVREIASYDYYNYIILDLSDSIQGLFQILRICERIYTITKNDGIAMAKIDQYEKTLAMIDLTEILDKTRKCNIPQFSNIPKRMEELPYSELAEYVKKLIKEDFDEEL